MTNHRRGHPPNEPTADQLLHAPMATAPSVACLATESAAGLSVTTRFVPADVRSAPDAAETWPVLSRLLAATPWARRSPDGGDNFPAGRRHLFRVGGDDLVTESSTIAIYTVGPDGTVTGRLLVGDFDISKAEATGAADPAALVAAEADAFAALVEESGGRVVHDISPSGGRHVYVKFARPIPFEDLRDMAVALADRFPTLDAAPMRSPSGQIRIAGSPYKRTPVEQPDGSYARTGPLLGFMALTMPLAEAVAVLRHPCGPRVWERLQHALTAERTALDPAPSLSAPVPGMWHLDVQGQPWVPLRGGRRPLQGRLATLARTGDWRNPQLQPEGRPYPSPSEARYGVLRSAAARGWTLTEVHEEARPGGAFAGLGALLGTRSPAQRRAVMTHDWQSVVREAATARTLQTTGRNAHTSLITHPPSGTYVEIPHWPVPRALIEASALSLRCHEALARWQTAVWLAERDPLRCKGWGRRAPSTRVVLRALALAARLTGDTTTAFGCRSLALMSGLSWRTVATVLADLRDESDPLVDLVARGRELDADRYTLRIPDAYRAETTRVVVQAGRIETGHPVWLGLEAGTVCALLYEILNAVEARPVDLQRRAVLSSSAVTDGLATLGAHGLAVHGPNGWRRGERTLDEVAAEVDGFDRYNQRIATYRAHREDWRAFLQSCGSLAAGLADLEAALAEHDRYVLDDDLAAEIETELQDLLSPTSLSDTERTPQPLQSDQGFPDEPEAACTPTVTIPDPARVSDDVIEGGPPGDPSADPSPSPEPLPLREIIAAYPPVAEEVARRGAAFTRRLMAAKTPDERERILSERA
ncbi:hypothetical protein [Actinomadura napierensis]|uniref:DNA primase/polymerase bifunctional N-terminal domain-containing protein n=1 Tax=Actinomadura napierensis TaxID=267854 RepID=A0ABN3AFE0_9ACTN